MEDNVKPITNYEIEETVHKSAEGVIYRAVDKTSGTRVFIKKYYPSLNWSEEVLNEFFNLAGYLRFIEHEYLLPVLDIGKHEGVPYVVFADDSFVLLSHHHNGQPGQKEVLNFLHKVAEALDFLHKQEIVHGGLQPENIVIDPNGFPLLFDFGLSGVFKKLLLENVDDGFENLSIASLKCTSPEQILGRNPTRLSDIYTFGAIGYHHIFGDLPFDGETLPDTALSHFSKDAIRTIMLPEKVSLNTLQLIQKCIQVEPEARFTGFPQILKNLERMKSGKRPGFKFGKRFAVEKPARRSRITPSFASAIALVMIGLFAGYYLYTRNTGTAASPTLAVTALPALATTTHTQQPRNETPVVSGAETQKPPMPAIEPESFKLAFEGEKPFGTTGEQLSPANLSNLSEISRLGYGKPEEADVAPDNNHIAVATSAGVFIFEGNELLKWIDSQAWATSVQFSPDGTVLAIGLKTGEIQLWDWAAGIKSVSLTGHTKTINRILFSQNGFLFSASADQHIIVWDLKSNRILHDISAHSRAVNDIAITSDARILVSCSDDRLIRVWNLASGTKLYELNSEYFEGSIRAIDISSDDAYLAAGGEAGYLYQWNLITTQVGSSVNPQLRTDIVPVKNRIWSLQYVRDDQELLVSIDDGRAVSYEAARQKYSGVSASFEIPLPSLKLVDVFGPDFNFDSFSVLRGEDIISINWDGQVASQQAQVISGMYDILDRLDFSPDGSILAAGGKRGSTHVWNLTTNQPLYKNLYFLPFGDSIAPDGASIALIVPKSIQTQSSVLFEDTYQIKNLTGTQSTRDLSKTIPDANVGYTSDGSLFIAANLTSSKAWDYTNGTEIRLNGYTYTGCWITASASNIKDILQVNSAAGIFSLVNDEKTDTLCPMTYRYKNVKSAFANDLSFMAYINSNGLLEGYDVSGKTSPWAPYRLTDPQAVTVIAISPDGSIIAVGETSGKISFINGETGEFVRELVGNFGTLHAIEFSENGGKIATAGSDGIVRVFAIVEPE